MKFTDTPMCKDRLNCRECRLVNDRYRKAWSAIYEMPINFPACPKGYPIGFKGFKKAVTNSQLGVLVDLPDSQEGRRVLQLVKERADSVGVVCEKCPSGDFVQFNDKEKVNVECRSGAKCCGGRLAQANVHLGSGFCNKGHFK